MTRSFLLFLLCLLVVPGCGGGGGQGPGPAQAGAAATLVSLTVTPAAARVAVGKTAQMTATGAYSDGSSRDVTSLATWSSGNAAAAAVGSSNGTVSGVAVGTARISAELGGISGGTDLTIIGPLAITGTQLDVPGNPVEGATATVVANGHTYQAVTDATGRYVLTIPAEDADLLPNVFMYTVSKDGYVPLDIHVTKNGSSDQSGRRLAAAGAATVVLESVPIAHHLGDETVQSGRWIHEFQAPVPEGATRTYGFTLASQPAAFTRAYVTFTHRGLETSLGFLNTMIINGHAVALPDSDPGGGATQSTLQVDRAFFLGNQRNSLTITSATTSGGTDLDDFEFVNVVVSFGN